MIGHVHLHVGDIPAASAFFSEALGFDRMVWQYPGALFLAASGYHHHLGTNIWAGNGAAPPTEEDAQLLEWTIELPGTASLEAASESLTRAGYPAENDDASGRGGTLMTRDPWGTRIRLQAVGYLIGSLAKASINRKLARALVRLAPAELELREIPFGDLPLYSYDYDANFPASARNFKDAVNASDAILFVTPEYNRSIPGGLKNAIDWGSRPYGKNAFSRKPTAIIGTSPGMIGTAVAQSHLRSILCFCNAPLMNTLEAYIQFTPGLINDAGEVTSDTTQQFLSNYMLEFQGFINRVHTALAAHAV